MLISAPHKFMVYICVPACVVFFQEEEVQRVQGQLSGSQQQLHLVQERLSSTGGAQPQAPFPNIRSNVQPPPPDQEYGLDQEYHDAQAYPGDQDADMEFEPPGSARGLERDPSFDPTEVGRPGAAPNARDDGQGAAGNDGQDQGQGDLYSPGLSAQPSGSYMTEPDLQSKLLFIVGMQLGCTHELLQGSWREQACYVCV